MNRCGHVSRRDKDGWCSACRKAYHLDQRYRLTVNEWLDLFEESDGLCAICYEVPAEVVDHDHSTGIVRGALCQECNKGLGLLGEANIASAQEYLSTPRSMGA